jgi:hypothetical protein
MNHSVGADHISAQKVMLDVLDRHRRGLES